MAYALPLINQNNKGFVYTAAVATALSLTALASPIEAIKIIGTTVLIGVTYGIANDMLACRDCIEYFTLGHFYDGKRFENRLVNSLDPNLNAISWGLLQHGMSVQLQVDFFQLSLEYLLDLLLKFPQLN